MINVAFVVEIIQHVLIVLESQMEMLFLMIVVSAMVMEVHVKTAMKDLPIMKQFQTQLYYLMVAIASIIMI